MEEVSKSFVLPPLSKEDMQRIDNCDHYRLAKRIIKSTRDYKEFEVGSAVYIRRNSSKKLVGQEYDSSCKPEKYIIVKNDEGFLFAKKICANGKPGVAILCLTIEYSSTEFSLEADGEYIEAVLLDNQENYNPLAEAQDYQKKKNKAARENAKKRLLFDTHIEALDFLKKAKIGDVFYRADYTYGGGITEYTVTNITRRMPIPPDSVNRWGSRNDEEYIDAGLDEVVILELNPVKSTSSYTYKIDLNYRKISKQGYPWLIFKDRPTTPEDIK